MAVQAAVVIAVLALVAIPRVDPVFGFQMFMCSGKFAAENDDSLRRVQTIGPDARKKPENEAADQFSHGIFLEPQRGRIREKYDLGWLIND
ncbi:MAG: hypothetical protein AB1647_09525, partial [Pseudomonadota bacterium]